MLTTIRKLFRSTRGQMRAVDFMVSAFIFLIMLAQFILLLFNIQIALHATIYGDINQNDASELFRQIFMQPGTPNWGVTPETPTSFGLALDFEQQGNQKTRMEIDPAKLARIGADASAIQSFNDFRPVTYQYIHNKLGLDDNTHFQLKLLPPINLTYQRINSNGGVYTYQLAATYTISGKPVINATISIITIDFVTGKANETRSTTNENGKTMVQVTAPTNKGNANEQGFGLVIIAKKTSTLWGINWIQDRDLTTVPGFVNIDGSSRRFATFLSWSAQKNVYFGSSSITDQSQITNQTLLVFEEQKDGSFEIVGRKTSIIQNPLVIETASSQGEGLSFMVHYVRVDSNNIITYYYRVFPLPTILDKTSGDDRFQVPLSPQILPENSRGKLTIQRVIVCRGLLLVAELTYLVFR